MSESHSVETEQAARESSGAHPYGRYLEEFEVGAVYKHWPAKTSIACPLLATPVICPL